MAKLSKAQSQLYVENEGEFPARYYGTPISFWFIAEQPTIRAWVESKHKLDYENEVWNQFTPNGEPFHPIGNRHPLVFQTNEPIRRSIWSTLKPGHCVTFGKISEDGLSPFDGLIEFYAKGAGGEHDELPHGTVWLAPADEGVPKETMYVSLVLEPGQLEAICREIIARPDAVLSIRLNFAAYQEEIERRISRGQGMFRLELDAHIPIIESQLSVVDRPQDEDRPAAGNLPDAPPPVAPVVVQPDFAPAVTRLNWALVLLVLIVLVMLFG
jgi:hypothetical protein